MEMQPKVHWEGAGFLERLQRVDMVKMVKASYLVGIVKLENIHTQAGFVVLPIFVSMESDGYGGE